MMSLDYEVALKNFKGNKILEAKMQFQSIVREDSENIDACYKLGICEFRLKQFKRALECFRTVIFLKPDFAEVWYYLGLTQERLGENKSAETNFRMALKIDPNYELSKKKLGIERSPIQEQGKASNRDNSKEQSSEGFFETSEEALPGRLLYKSNRRRFTSFSVHMIILMFTVLVGTLLLIEFDAPIYLLLPIFPLLDLIPRSYRTKYEIRERRIDIYTGIFFQKHVSVWLFQIEDIEYTRGPINLLTKNACIRFVGLGKKYFITGMIPPIKNSGVNSVTFTKSLFEDLRNVVKDERNEIKKMWQ